MARLALNQLPFKKSLSEATSFVITSNYGDEPDGQIPQDLVRQFIDREVAIQLGYAAPLPYEANIDVLDARTTVFHDGIVYAPSPAVVPFRTSEVFNFSLWQPARGDVALRQALNADSGGSFLISNCTIVGVTRTLSDKLNDVVSVLDAGAKADGSDATNAFLKAVGEGRQVLVPKGEYRVGSLSVPNGVSFIFEPGAVLRGPGAGSFVTCSTGSVRIQGEVSVSGYGNFVTLAADTNLDLLEIEGVSYLGTSSTAAAAVGSLLTYFPTTAHIKRLVVRKNQMFNGRAGFLYRGSWDSADVSNNVVSGAQLYGLRMGQDRSAEEYALQKHCNIFNNVVTNIYNPVTGSGSNEANGIAVFSQSASIYSNYVNDVNNAGLDDCEGIYTKIRYGSITNNTVVDATRREGNITIKTTSPELGTDYVQTRMIQCSGNVSLFTKARSHEASISIQSSNVDCYGNYVHSGLGVSAESGGIVVKYRSPYRNIRVRDNMIYCTGGGTYGVLIWGYGEHVTVKGNRIIGAGNHAIRIETRTNDVRTPTEGTAIGNNYVIEENEIISETVGATAGFARGIGFSVSSASPMSDVLVRRNRLRGGCREFGLVISASASKDWLFEDNDFGEGARAVSFVNLPNNIRFKGNRGALVSSAQGQASVSSGNTTVTVTAPISSLLGAYFTPGDVWLAPLSAASISRGLFVDTTYSSGNFRVTAVNAGGAAAFGWMASIENKLLNPIV